MANKTNTSSKSVDGSQTNFLNFQPKTQREQDLYNLVNGRLQEFAAVDPEYAGVMENSKTSSEYTIPSASVAPKHHETIPQEPVFSKKELEEKIQSEVKSEVQKEVHREVQKVVSQEVQKEVQRIVPEEVQKAVEKITPGEAPKHVTETADDDFIESNVGNLFIEDNEQQVSQSSNFEENGSDNDDDTLDKVKRVLLILVFIGLLAAVIFFSLRRCSNTPEGSVVVTDTTMQESNSVQEEKAEPAVEPQITKSTKTDLKIEDLKCSTPKSTKSEKTDKVSVQQPISTVAKETKPTQSKAKAAKADNSLAKSISAAVESTKTAESVKIAELEKAEGATKTEEPTKVVEPAKVTEPAKTEEPVKVEVPAKVEEPVKVAVPEKTTQPQAVAPKQEPEPNVAKDLPFQEKNSKQAVSNTAPTVAKAPVAKAPAAKAPVAKAPAAKTPAPAPKPVKAPVKVATTKPTTDDLKDLEKQKDNTPRICTPDKVPTQGYVISYSTTKNESTAIKTVMIITRTKHLPCGYYWLGDSKTQKKASLFRVYVGPYKTAAEAQAALTGILDVAPDAKVYSENPAKK